MYRQSGAFVSEAILVKTENIQKKPLTMAIQHTIFEFNHPAFKAVPRLPVRRGFFFGIFMTQKKVCCFIDGFNLYHSIADLISRDKSFHRANYLKWINLRALADAFIKKQEETLCDVLYFSAYAYWLPDSRKRHEAFIAANQEKGVVPILGNFKEKQKRCPKCGQNYITHEEKQSDVNIAVYLTHYAHHNDFDKAFILTADSDLCHAIRLMKMRFPEKEVSILIPPGRSGFVRELRECSDSFHKIKRQHLENSRLPEKMTDSKGNKILCPSKYKKQ
jgi:uncharacterized LabA/DUF88 family protein